MAIVLTPYIASTNTGTWYLYQTLSVLMGIGITSSTYEKIFLVVKDYPVEK